MKYKNLGTTSKVFYGVKIHPGEVQDVPGYINSPTFVRIDDSVANTSLNVTDSSKPIQLDKSEITPKTKKSKESKSNEAINQSSEIPESSK